MPATAAPACLLCSNAVTKVVGKLTGAEVRQLWAAHGDLLSPEAFLPMQAESIVELYRCGRCGFRYADPAYAGGPRFYEELARNAYYSAATPEFDEVLDFGGRHGLRTVLDIGCGHGAFLDRAAARGFATSGLELTPAAAEHCRQRGHRVLSTPLEELPEGSLAQADLVTMFQVVEHVRAPCSFVRQARTLAVPGGYLAVSVPYDGGINGWADLVPHQWPPHHITRWRHRDLRALGESCGMHLVALHANVLTGSELRRYLRLNRQLGLALDPPRRCMPRALITAIGWAYTLLGARYWLPRLGANTTAIYRVPNG